MCYFVKLTVILQNDIPSIRSKFKSPTGQKGAWVQGKFPDYWITDKHCSCDLVRDKGTTLIDVPDIVKEFLALEEIKRIDLIWYWGDEPKVPMDIIKIDFPEFIIANDHSQLKVDTLYRVSEMSKFHHQ